MTKRRERARRRKKLLDRLAVVAIFVTIAFAAWVALKP